MMTKEEAEHGEWFLNNLFSHPVPKIEINRYTHLITRDGRVVRDGVDNIPFVYNPSPKGGNL